MKCPCCKDLYKKSWLEIKRKPVILVLLSEKQKVNIMVEWKSKLDFKFLCVSQFEVFRLQLYGYNWQDPLIYDIAT